MHRLVVLALVLPALLLAGCGAKKDDGADKAEPTACELEPVLCDPTHPLADHDCIVGMVHPRVYAPDTPGPDSEPDPWRQGDFWRYRLSIDGEAEDTLLVYYDDADVSAGQAQHYMVGVPAREEALEHALFSVNPMLGRIHRSLYSPHEGGLHADMFNFPLCDGATWTTGFYDTQFDLTARLTELELPDGSKDPLGFVIEGEASDGSTLRHTYSPQAKWFTELEMSRADGLEVTMTLLEVGSGRTGRMEFLRGQNDEVLDVSDIAEAATVVRADGQAGPYDTLGVFMDVERTAGTGKVEVHVRNPAGDSVACIGFAGTLPVAGETQCAVGPLKAEFPWQAGTWTVTVEREPLDTSTTVDGEVRLVDIYDIGGTV